MKKISEQLGIALKSIVLFTVSIWLFMTTMFWRDIKKQQYEVEKLRILKPMPAPPRYDIVQVSAGAVAGICRINKVTGETDYYSPKSKVLGWVRISDTEAATDSNKQEDSK